MCTDVYYLENLEISIPDSIAELVPGCFLDPCFLYSFLNI